MSDASAPTTQDSRGSADIAGVREGKHAADRRLQACGDIQYRGKAGTTSLSSAPAPSRDARSPSTRARRSSRPSADATCKSRPVAHQLLLPLLYAAFIFLHLFYWLYATSKAVWGALIQQDPAPESVEASLLRIGSFKRAGGEAPASGQHGIRIPRHLALAMPLAPSQPSPRSMIPQRVSRILQAALRTLGSGRGAWVTAGARQLPQLRLHPFESSERKDSAQQDMSSKEKSRRGRSDSPAICIESLARWAALAGVEELTVWDEREEVTRWLAMRDRQQKQIDPSDITRGFLIDIEIPEVPGQSPRHLRLSVDVRDGERRMLRSACSNQAEEEEVRQKSSDGDQDGPATDSESVPEVEQLKLVLNVLTPRYDGREAFASVSQCIASNIRQEFKKQSRASANAAETNTPTLQADSTKQPSQSQQAAIAAATGQDSRETVEATYSASQQRWIQRRLLKVGVSEVDDALKRSFGLPCSEPDLLIVCTRLRGHHRGGGAVKPVLTLGEFPRWLIRITEIFHCYSAVGGGNKVRLGTEEAEEILSVHDFWASLEQFSRAEQRNGR